ncbi:MAG TPA: metal ABC transporter substrate-binding protein, partial [Planctomycetota bacterium]|nr:metal ABC transporter substrate-binding protein [Planctomycetota bacterium]
MQRLLLRAALAAAALAPFAAAVPAVDGELRVVTTIPDLADVVRELGGERVSVHSLARGTENVHAVDARPSDLVALNRADLFVQMGLSLEHSFVPGLLEAARNPRLRPGSPGFVNASEGFEPIEVPDEVSRREAADLHPFGNPHWNLDPRAGRHMAERVLAGLVAVDPEGREAYAARHAAYLERLAEAEARWERLAAGWRGRKLVAYHREFSYLAARYGIEVVGEVESRPGVAPKPRELADLVERMRAEGVTAILTAKWSNGKAVRFVAEHTGARVIEVPTMVGGSQRATAWIALLDELHDALALAFGAAEGGGAAR